MRIFGGMLLTLVGFTALAQAPQPPIVKVEGLRQISPRVHIIPDNSVPLVPNVGYVVGDRAVLVIDTGLGPPNGAAVYEVAKKLAGDKAVYLVTTHVHPEHDLGAQAFPATTTLIRATAQVKDIADFGLQLARIFAGRSAVHAELLKDADFRKADITFEQDYDLDLGGVHAKLVAMGPNHTAGDTIVWIESERVLFSGDIAMRAQPAFASPRSSRRHWLASLDRLEQLKPAIIVPSHGPTGDGTLFVSNYRAYLTEVRDRTAAEKRAGRSADQAVGSGHGRLRRPRPRQGAPCRRGQGRLRRRAVSFIPASPTRRMDQGPICPRVCRSAGSTPEIDRGRLASAIGICGRLRAA